MTRSQLAERSVRCRPFPAWLCGRSAVLGLAVCGWAVTAGRAQTLPAALPAQEQADSERPDAPLSEQPPDIVVTGKRYGAAVMDPERELDEDEIAAYALNSIREVMSEVGPQIDGNSDRPILLVNGQRIADPRDITSYPPDALQRLEILPPDAAQRYGYSAGQRVVNLVLKRQFDNGTVELGVAAPTAGGRVSSTLGLGRVGIRDATRWNLSLQARRETPLYQRSRSIPAGTAPASAGNSISAVGGGEIDPRLSALAGTIVTVAGIPAVAGGGMPSLADFVATANRVGGAQQDDERTLLAGSQGLSLNAGASVPLGRFNASLSLRADASGSRQLTGLPTVSLVLPAGNPWSQFAVPISLTRVLAGRPLATRQYAVSTGLSASLNGEVRGWALSLAGNIDASRSRSTTDRAPDAEALQTRLDALDISFDPWGTLPALPVRRDLARSSSLSATMRLTADRGLAALPAGRASINISAGLAGARSTARAGSDDGLATMATNRQADARVTLNIPLTANGKALGFLGTSSASLGAGRYLSTGASARTQLTGSVDWTPFAALHLSAGYGRDQSAPSSEQLSAPRVETANVPVYDFARQEVATIVQITGGNPALGKGIRQNLRLDGSLRPFAKARVQLHASYTVNEAVDGIGAFPSLTAAVEKAFPDRVVRDAEGRLLSIDTRPITIASDRSSQLSGGLSLGLPFGPMRAVPSPNSPAPRASSPTGSKGAPTSRLAARREGSLQLNLTETLALTNRTLIRSGLPIFDRLAGDGGGVSRTTLGLQATASYKGVAMALSGRRRGASRTRAAALDGAGDLRFSPYAAVDLRLSLDPGRFGRRMQPVAWYRKIRVSLDVTNLFDARQRVRLANGSPAPGFSRDESDPLGRIARLSLTGRF
ncbi:hypothetical protein [Sphingomonas sp.]|uniref:hypothetical protein n=1 Tax=Sphingomonas sp. TaxID=28214 RepID=UPI0025FF18A9|nr:hypothetical protein [Sphingomonas sp.]